MAVDQRAEGVEWVARKEVCFGALLVSVVICKMSSSAYIFEIVKQVGHSFALRVGQDIIIVDFLLSCGRVSAVGARVESNTYCCSNRTVFDRGRPWLSLLLHRRRSNPAEEAVRDPCRLMLAQVFSLYGRY